MLKSVSRNLPQFLPHACTEKANPKITTPEHNTTLLVRCMLEHLPHTHHSITLKSKHQHTDHPNILHSHTLTLKHTLLTL